MEYMGTWLAIRNADDYSPPHFIKFEGQKPIYYRIINISGTPLKLQRSLSFQQAPLKVEEVDNYRLRFHNHGNNVKVMADGSTTTTEIIHQRDYQKLLPTETTLSDEGICSNSYEFTWNKNNIEINFNDYMPEPEYIMKLNKRLGYEGRKITLERFEETLFLAFYDNGSRENLVPIKFINERQIELYGFPELLYCYRTLNIVI